MITQDEKAWFELEKESTEGLPLNKLVDFVEQSTNRDGIHLPEERHLM